MDLKDVIVTVLTRAKEADKAFHAGHHEVSENYLRGIRALIIEYEKDKAKTADDVTESATSEKPAETSQETPAAPGGPAAQAGAVLPADAAQQKDLDQAGP